MNTVGKKGDNGSFQQLNKVHPAVRTNWDLQSQSLPLWGRWHGEAVTEEGSTHSPKQMQFGGVVPQPHQSKIRDFCQLLHYGMIATGNH